MIDIASFSLFVLSTIGLTNVLVHGKIFDKEHLGFRPWLDKQIGKYVGDKYRDVLECYECTGWWSALLTSFILISFNPFICVCCAFAGAALGHFYSALYLLIESKIEYVVDNDEEESNGEVQSD